MTNIFSGMRNTMSGRGSAGLDERREKIPFFTDKRILITGASSGIGRALSYWYARQR